MALACSKCVASGRPSDDEALATLAAGNNCTSTRNGQIIFGSTHTCMHPSPRERCLVERCRDGFRQDISVGGFVKGQGHKWGSLSWALRPRPRARRSLSNTLRFRGASEPFKPGTRRQPRTDGTSGPEESGRRLLTGPLGHRTTRGGYTINPIRFEITNPGIGGLSRREARRWLDSKQT